jgi:4,5-dihydroxyphthalate decarboxylase
MNKVPLTLAIGDYDHTRDLVEGRVPVEGVELTTLTLPPEELFYRFTLYREWDVSEMSMGKVVSLRSQDDDSMVAIPVFVSRVFRQSMIYVRAGSPIRRPDDLKGKRIGIPEWAQTAGIYGRGFLTQTAGVPLTSVEWIQAGLNQPGRIEKVELKLPDGMRYSVDRERTLSDMLLAGEIDAILSARAPLALGKGIEHLFPDYQRVEEEYYRRTGIYPIMHVIAFRKEVLDRHPWLAMNFMTAFEAAKRRSYERITELGVSRLPMPWVPNYVQHMRDVFGGDWFPYGLEPNRKTLQAFCDFAYEQGVCHRRLDAAELFAPTTFTTAKV